MIIYTVRPALQSESNQIKELIGLVGINPTGLDWKRFVVAASDGGRVIGCGQIKPHGQEIRELASIASHPDVRGQGIARAVIEHLLSDNHRPLYLMCMSHNGALYQKFGFHILTEEEMPRYFKRIQKIFNLADIFRKSSEELLVMKLE